MKAIILSIILILFFNNYYSCGNEYGYSLEGKRIHTRYFFLSNKNYKFNKLEIKARLNKLTLELEEKQGNYKILSDIAINLMKLGQADSSVQILKKLVIEKPKEYNLSANLGTAYELVGELDSALKYISKGYQLNKHSHRGSEWIHIKILEAKIKEKTTPDWIINNPIISTKVLSRFKNDNLFDEKAVRRINENLFYQIKTRVPFTPAPNQTIVNLLITLGDFNVKYGTYENSILAYVYALKFNTDFGLRNNIKEKIKKLNRKKQERVKKVKMPFIFEKILKRSYIDPNILVLGIDEIEDELEKLAQIENIYIDSLTLLKLQKDSLEQLNLIKNETLKKGYKILALKSLNEKNKKDKTITYLTFALVVLSVLLFFFYLKIRNKNKLN